MEIKMTVFVFQKFAFEKYFLEELT